MIDVRRLLVEMVSIDSVSGQEQELAQHLVARMRASGAFDAHVDQAGNAVGIRSAPGTGGKTIVLLGHIDTVPGDVPRRIDGDTLYGRGSVDAKGPFAAFIAAAERATLPPGTTLVVIGAVEEEIHTSKGARFAAQRAAPDACIIGEPSGWDAVTIGYKGCFRLDYELERECGHGAGPERSAGEHAVEFWQAIAAFAADFNRDRELLFDRLLPSLASIRTDSDGLHDRAAARLGFRLPLEFDVAALERHCAANANGATLRFYGHEPAWRVGRTDPLAQAFSRAFRRRDLQPRFKCKTGTSDMNILGPVWRCPIVAYGPGDSSLDHTPNEHTSLAEVERSVEVLIDVIEQVAVARAAVARFES